MSTETAMLVLLKALTDPIWAESNAQKIEEAKRAVAHELRRRERWTS